MRSSTPTLYETFRGNRRAVTRQARILALRLPAPEVARWYVVGDDIPFENDWENYPDGNSAILGFNPASYLKDSSGFVHLRGMIQNFTDPKQVALILPVGFRPPRIESHPARWSGQDPEPAPEAFIIYIRANGEVSFSFGDTDAQYGYQDHVAPWVSLDSHRFRAA